MTQQGLPVFASPSETDLYRWSISPMNVGFKMESLDHQFKTEYVAPEKPVKPNKNDWTNKAEMSNEKKLYAKKLSAYNFEQPSLQ